MLTPIRLPLIGLFLLLSLSGVNAFQDRAAKPPADAQERNLYRNEYGAVIGDTSGKRLNYSKSQLEAQASQAKAQSGQVQIQASPSDLTTPPAVEPVWSYAAFGTGIGVSNLVVAKRGDHMELYMGGYGGGFGGSGYWYALAL